VLESLRECAQQLEIGKVLNSSELAHVLNANTPFERINVSFSRVTFFALRHTMPVSVRFQLLCTFLLAKSGRKVDDVFAKHLEEAGMTLAATEFRTLLKDNF